MSSEMSRRKFLKKGAAAAIGLAVVPGTVLGKKFGHTAPSDKLNILGVGIGGRGSSVLRGLESQNIIGLCDVDWKYADHVFKRYPAAMPLSPGSRSRLTAVSGLTPASDLQLEATGTADI